MQFRFGRQKQGAAMASPDPRTVFLVFIVVLVVVVIILLGICWKFLKPDIMRKLMRPRSPGSGEENHHPRTFHS
jgi:hypothetical protein